MDKDSVAKFLLIGLLAVCGGLYVVSVLDSKPAAASPTTSASAASSAPVAAGGTSNIFASQFDKHLITLSGGPLAPYDASSLKSVKYFAFYYSASWCPPCREFTPKLVSFYKDFKPQHPNFELIFVNHDQNEDDMLTYMRNDEMTWPAVRYSDIDGVNADRYCGSGIPDLVLVDADGKVLSDSFSGGQYTGPYHVIDDIKSMVQ